MAACRLDDAEPTDPALLARLDALEGEVAALRDGITERDDRIAALSEALAEVDERVTPLTQEVARLDGVVQVVEADLAGLGDEVAAKQDAATAATDTELSVAVAGVAGVTREELEAGAFDPSAWLAEGGWLDEAFVREAELEPLEERISEVEGRVSGLEAEAVTRDLLQSYASDTELAAVATALDVLQQRLEQVEATSVTVDQLAPYATQSWVTSNFAGIGDLVVLDDRLAWVEQTSVAPDQAVRLYDPAGAPERDAAALRVPTDFPDLQAALDFLAPRRLLSPVTVQIEREACGMRLDHTLRLDHPDGAMITLVGGVGCPLVVDHAGAALVVTGGTLASIELACAAGASCGDGLVLEAGAAVQARDLVITGAMIDGVVLQAGASLSVQGLRVTGARGVGVGVYDSATLTAEGVHVADVAGTGLFARGHARLHAEDAELIGVGSGVWAGDGSHVEVAGVVIQDAAGNGISAHDGSFVDAWAAQIQAGRTCAYAWEGSTIVLQEAVLSGATDHGVWAGARSTVNLNEAWLSGPTEGHGVFAQEGSVIHARDAAVDQPARAGFALEGGSLLFADSSSVVASGEAAFLADRGSLIVAEGADAREGAGPAFVAAGGSHLAVDDATARHRSPSSPALWLSEGSSGTAAFVTIGGDGDSKILVTGGSSLTAPYVDLGDGRAAITGGSSADLEGAVSESILASGLSWLGAVDTTSGTLDAWYNSVVEAWGADGVGEADMPEGADPRTGAQVWR